MRGKGEEAQSGASTPLTSAHLHPCSALLCSALTFPLAFPPSLRAMLQVRRLPNTPASPGFYQAVTGPEDGRLGEPTLIRSQMRTSAVPRRIAAAAPHRSAPLIASLWSCGVTCPLCSHCLDPHALRLPLHLQPSLASLPPAPSAPLPPPSPTPSPPPLAPRWVLRSRR